MTAKNRKFYSFINFGPPQRHFVVMQFLILSAVRLLLVDSSFERFRNVSEAHKSRNLSGQQIHLYLTELYKALFIQVLVIFCAGFLVNVLFGLLFLHRITGPLVRVRYVLNKIAEGEYPGGLVRFRKDDFLKDLAVSLSRLLDFLNRMNVTMKPAKDKSSVTH